MSNERKYALACGHGASSKRWIREDNRNGLAPSQHCVVLSQDFGFQGQKGLFSSSKIYCRTEVFLKLNTKKKKQNRKVFLDGEFTIVPHNLCPYQNRQTTIPSRCVPLKMNMFRFKRHILL